MTLEEKIEKIIADNNNKLLDAVNGLTNPTLGELVEPASRAILAAIKDLVQKCKPEEKHSIHPMTTTANARNNGYNLAIKHFEQNILKALGEK